MNLFATVSRRIVDYRICPVVALYEDSKKDDPVLNKYNLTLTMKQKDEKLRKEYEAFINMHDADGIFTASVRSTEL